MRSRNHIGVLGWLAVVVMGFGVPASAAWTLVDNFDQLSPGPWTEGESSWNEIQTNTSGADSRVWEVRPDPGNLSNNTLYLGGEYNSSLQKVFPEGQSIPTNGVGTYYYRFRMADFFSGAGPSVGIGLTDEQNAVSSDPGSPNQVAAYANLNAVSDGGTTSTEASTNTLNTYQLVDDGNGGMTPSSITASSIIGAETWYQMWYVVDHTDDSYEAYIQGGSSYPTQTLIEANGAFRQQADDVEFGEMTALTRAFIRPNNNNAVIGDAIYFDDIFIDGAGSNLSTPLAPAFLQGDFNGANGIDLVDFQTLASNLLRDMTSLGAANAYDTYAAGDFDFDTDIDLDDFFLFQEAYALANPAAASLTVQDLYAAANIPEPSTVVLFALGGLGLAACRRAGKSNTTQSPF